MTATQPSPGGSQESSATPRDPKDAGATADRNPAPEPSTDDQVDIADRVQKGIGKANDRDSPQEPSDAGRSPAMDGNPAPEPDDDGGVFKPADDTPAVLDKRSGPKNP